MIDLDKNPPLVGGGRTLPINILLQQKGGTIKGDVTLSSGGGNVLEMTGGTIDGEVSATSRAASILNLNGGSITKAINLGSKGDTVNLGGTAFQSLKGGMGADILNVNENYVLNGTIAAIPTINVAENKTFTVNKTIDDINDLLSIASKSKVEVNTNITGTGKVENKGELGVNNNQIVKMGDVNNQNLLTVAEKGLIQTNTFTQTAAGSVFSVALLPDGTGARIELLGTGEVANFAADTMISPYFPSGVPTTSPTFYDILVANNGSKIVDNATLVAPSNMTPGLSLKKSLVEDDRILRILVQKGLIISTPDTKPHQTSQDGNITVTSTGSVNKEIGADTAGTVIDNAGKIKNDLNSNSYGIDVSAANVTVNNQESGFIQGGSGYGSGIYVTAKGSDSSEAAGFTLTNAGTISATQGIAAVSIRDVTFNNITNSGTFEAIGGESGRWTAALYVLNGSGTITNTKTGVIKSEGQTYSTGNGAVSLKGDNLILNNEGSILSTGTESQTISLDKGNIVLNNKGNIESNTNGVDFSSDLAVLNNSGTIKVNNKDASALIARFGGAVALLSIWVLLVIWQEAYLSLILIKIPILASSCNKKGALLQGM